MNPSQVEYCHHQHCHHPPPPSPIATTTIKSTSPKNSRLDHLTSSKSCRRKMTAPPINSNYTEATRSDGWWRWSMKSKGAESVRWWQCSTNFDHFNHNKSSRNRAKQRTNRRRRVDDVSCTSTVPTWTAITSPKMVRQQLQQSTKARQVEEEEAEGLMLLVWTRLKTHTSNKEKKMSAKSGMARWWTA